MKPGVFASFLVTPPSLVPTEQHWENAVLPNSNHYDLSGFVSQYATTQPTHGHRRWGIVEKTDRLD